MKKIYVLVICLFLLLTNVGFADREDNTLHILNIFMDERSEYADKMLKERYPGMNISYDIGSAREIVANLFAGDTKIDIMAFCEHEGFSPQYAAFNGALADLLQNEEIGEMIDDYYENALDKYMYEGQLYAVPYMCQPYFWYANPQLFAEMGLELPEDTWTWEDYFELGETVFEYNIENDTDYLLMYCALQYYPLMQFAANTVDYENKTHAFDSQVFRELVEKWKYLFDIGVVASRWTYDFESADIQKYHVSLAKTDALFSVRQPGSFAMDGILVKPEEVIGEENTYRFVIPPADEGMNRGVEAGRSLGISKTSEMQEEALYWLSCYMSYRTPVGSGIYDGRHNPSHISNGGVLFKNDEWMKHVRSTVTVENSWLLENLDHWEKYVQDSAMEYYNDLTLAVTYKYWNQLIEGEITEDEYIDMCVKLADQYLGE